MLINDFECDSDLILCHDFKDIHLVWEIKYEACVFVWDKKERNKIWREGGAGVGWTLLSCCLF